MAKDPYRYFRIEARELLEGLTQGILALEKGDASDELIGRLLRQAHTLKGAARIVNQVEVAELAHAIEDLLVLPGDRVSGDRVSRLLALADSCGERLKPVLAAPQQESDAAGSPDFAGPVSSVRVEVADLDAILYDLAEMTVRLATSSRETAGLERAEDVVNILVNALAEVPDRSDSEIDRALILAELGALATETLAQLRAHQRSLQDRLDRARQDVDHICERVSHLRLLPVQEIFAPLERTVRDAAEALKKRVTFAAIGGQYRLDAHVLFALRDSLIHVVRNSVAHGIEDESERQALGKRREGRIQLHVQRKGGRVHFVVEDDGRGIDVEAVRRVVIERKLASPAESESLGMDEAVRLLFQGGFSTAPAVTKMMGRGVGLDVVRATVAGLKGEVDLRSNRNQGTAVEIAVPASLESVDVLAVVAGGATVLIPFDAILRTLRLTGSDLSHSAAGTTLSWEQQTLPFCPLADILSISARHSPLPSKCIAVVVESRCGTVAVGVDCLEGSRAAVVRPLPAMSGPAPLVAGMAVDAAGDPQLVLDPTVLGAAIRSATGRRIEPATARPLPVLIVDDSLTSRMLEQSVLETAGYQVDLAVSGEEALEKAKQNRYAAFLVDVEMPGMSGFELLDQFREDPILCKVPAILVTSRAGPDDQRRGDEAGAIAHISKGSFDANRLLSIIRDIIGGMP